MSPIYYVKKYSGVVDKAGYPSAFYFTLNTNYRNVLSNTLNKSVEAETRVTLPDNVHSLTQQVCCCQPAVQRWAAAS